MASRREESKIKVRFFTKDQDETLHAEDAPIFVPVSSKRFSLSELVNVLINSDKQTPFEFLIDGQLLKTTIEEYLIKHGLSSETFLSLEYTKAILPPSYLASFNNEDWISSIDTINVDPYNPSVILQPKILSGSYDGIVRTYNMSGTVEKQYAGHSGPIKSVKFISSTRIVSSGNDRQIRLWKTSLDDGVKDADDSDDEVEDGKTLAILEGHKAPVVSLAVDNKTRRILSASSDNTVGLWSTNYKEMPIVEVNLDENNLSTATKKRRRLAIKDSTVRRRGALSYMESHSQPVEQVIFASNDSTVAYSVSQDHTIKTWDLVTSRCVDTKKTSYSLLSIMNLSKLNLLVCGSSARHITLHDPRSEAVETRQFFGHRNFVVGFDQSPDNDYVFSSASHDGTVKVWDIRSDKALFTITRESGKGKVFDVKWDSKIGIISGGEDKKIQINKGDNITK